MAISTAPDECLNRWAQSEHHSGSFQAFWTREVHEVIPSGPHGLREYYDRLKLQVHNIKSQHKVNLCICCHNDVTLFCKYVPKLFKISFSSILVVHSVLPSFSSLLFTFLPNLCQLFVFLLWQWLPLPSILPFAFLLFCAAGFDILKCRCISLCLIMFLTICRVKVFVGFIFCCPCSFGEDCLQF